MFRTKFFISLLDFYRSGGEHYAIGQNEKMLRIKFKRDGNGGPSKNVRIAYRNYWADRILQRERQSVVHDLVSDGVIDSMIHGFDNIILACGPHCTGKTFNITGLNHKYEGIVPRLIDDAVELRNDRGGLLAMSCVEIKDNRVFDLLQADDDSDLSPMPVSIKDVSKHTFESSDTAKHKFWKANAKRTAVRGNLQELVHVYDFIVTFYYWNTSQHYTLSESICAKVHIVELAGVGPDVRIPLKHQIQANRTALELCQFIGHVVNANVKGNRESIRNLNISSTSMLLKYFQGSFSKQYTTLKVVCHIRPEAELLTTNMSVLEIGKSLRRLSNSVLYVPVSEPETMQLHIQTDHLRHELHLYGRFDGQKGMNTMDAKRYERLRNSVLTFLKSETDDIVLPKGNFADAFTVLSVFKEYCDKITNQENHQENNSRTASKFVRFPVKSLPVNTKVVGQTAENIRRAVNQTLPALSRDGDAWTTAGRDDWEAFKTENSSDMVKYDLMSAEIRDAQRSFEIDSRNILKHQENVLQMRDHMDKLRRTRHLSGNEEYDENTGNVIVPGEEKRTFQHLKIADDELKKLGDNFVQTLNNFNQMTDVYFELNQRIHEQFKVFRNRSNIYGSDEIGEKTKGVKKSTN